MIVLQLGDIVLLQLAVVLVASVLVAAAIRPLRQPAVIAQILVGIVLGPSLLGLVPGVQHWLFPAGSLGVIRELGQVGLVVYMFGVGNELNHRSLAKDARGVALVSVVSLAVPLLVGSVISLALVGDPRLFPAGGSQWPKVIFFGTAMAVTALPVMARIVAELGIQATRAANLAIAAGSVTDAAAWGLLAVVLAGVSGNVSAAALALVGAVVFALVSVAVVGPALHALVPPGTANQDRGRELTVLVAVLLLSAFTTAAIGIHPAFGAFVAGAVAPRNETTAYLRSWLIGPVSFLLLPLFFVYAGLNTRAGLIGTPELIALTLAIIAAACLSKGAACWFAARLAGLATPDAIAVGALMNARGLVELILLTIGLERGIITPALYSMMVLMTLATTFIASPVIQSLRSLAPTGPVPVRAPGDPAPGFSRGV